MPPEVAAPGAFILAAVVAFAATPIAIRIARATSFFDVPAGYKGHRQPTPYLGGAAIVAAVVAAAFAFRGDAGGLGLILGIAVALWLLGTADDRVSLPLLPRAMVEVGVAALLWASGHGWSAFGWGPADVLLTVVWVFGVMNAFNLMDNMDGAAATTAVVSACGAGALALVVGEGHLAVLAFAVGGACAGFLPLNLASPARIFMGDGGSLPVGFLVAAVVMEAAAANSPGLSAVVVASLLVGVVVVDTALVTVSRLRGGRQVLLGGSDHLTHRIVRRLGSPRRVALSLGTAQLVLCAAAVTTASIEVLWILMVGSVAATLGVVLIWTLESAQWAQQHGKAGGLDGPPAPWRGPSRIHEPANGISIVAASSGVSEPEASAGQPVAGRRV